MLSHEQWPPTTIPKEDIMLKAKIIELNLLIAEMMLYFDEGIVPSDFVLRQFKQRQKTLKDK